MGKEAKIFGLGQFNTFRLYLVTFR